MAFADASGNLDWLAFKSLGSGPCMQKRNACLGTCMHGTHSTEGGSMRGARGVHSCMHACMIVCKVHAPGPSACKALPGHGHSSVRNIAGARVAFRGLRASAPAYETES